MTDRIPETDEFITSHYRVPTRPGEPPFKHVFDRESVLAINTALATGRPLLVRGDPGVGKSQLARAAAHVLERPFISTFMTTQTQAQDLLWFEDAVTRLAEAQTFALRQVNESESAKATAAEYLARERFIRPGSLWWALNWASAKNHNSHVKTSAPTYAPPSKPEHGVLLLIDEIDKADNSVPNGLLEVLGQGTFDVPGLPEPIYASEVPPLVVLTTNEDRTLPDAFVRRCVVLHLRLPDAKRWPDEYGPDDLVEWLVERGRAHHPTLHAPELPEDQQILRVAAQRLARDREIVGSAGFCSPGLAEYLDLLRGAIDRSPERALQRLHDIAPYLFHKHADPGPQPRARKA